VEYSVVLANEVVVVGSNAGRTVALLPNNLVQVMRAHIYGDGCVLILLIIAKAVNISRPKSEKNCGRIAAKIAKLAVNSRFE